MAVKKSSGTAKSRRDLYKSSKRMESNRKIKLEKQLKLQPNNENIKAALRNIHFRRKTPKNPLWSHSMIATAKLFKLFGGKFDPKVFHPDPKISQAALSEQSPKASTPVVDKFVGKNSYNFFSIGARVLGWS